MSRDRRALRLLAPLTVFLSNGAIMTVELVAGRVVAPHVGVSLYTWTGIFGVMLAGMALGNALGGRMADRVRARPALAALFLAAAAGCGVMLALDAAAGALAPLHALPWPARILAHTLIVFLAPATLLGAISPVAARMALAEDGDPARTVGAIFAAGVAGSILATFLTGFYLVPAFPVPAIVGVAGGVLAGAGLMYVLWALRAPGAAPAPPAAAPETGSAAWRAWLAPNATVFASNTAFMVVEMAAMRIVAMEFGASIYTWTTIIGVVLAGVTAGNYLGGRLAERNASAARIATLFLLAALALLAAPFLSRAMGDALRGNYRLLLLSWPAQILLFTAAGFLAPNVFIGMISPAVAKRALERRRAAGETIGGLYASATAGNILGTFAAGFWLVDWFSPQAVVAWMALLMAAAGLAHAPRRVFARATAAAALAALIVALAPGGTLRALGIATALRPASPPEAIYEDHSRYSYIAILEDPENPRKREMLLDKLTHSQVNLDDPLDVSYEYEQVYRAVIDREYPGAQPLRAFVIGGGGYSFPRFLEVARPGSYIEVAEIDPEVTEAAHAAFGLPRDTAIRIFNQDARNRVEDLKRLAAADPAFAPFDCIFGDSINDYTVPYHLTTLEFARDVHSLLAPDGMYLLNLIDMYSSGKFAGAVANTLRQVFGAVYVFNTGRPAQVRDTFIVVCCKSPRDLTPLAAGQKMIAPAGVDYLVAQSGGIILTDRFAPVENLLAPVVRTRRGDPGEIHLAAARRAAAEDRLEAAIARAGKAVAVHPHWPEAWEFLADCYGRQGRAEDRWAALEKAALGNPNPAAVQAKLAGELMRAGHTDRAIPLYQAALEAEPGNALHAYNLGSALAAAQRLPEAAVAWERALEARPGHLDTLHNLALAYLMMQQYPSAWRTVGQIQAAGGSPDPQLLATLQQAAPR